MKPRLRSFLSAIALAALSSMAPAMAHPQHNYSTDVWPKVAVGLRGTASRTMMSISSAQNFCRNNRGCRLSADIQLGPGNWTSNTNTRTYFPNASLPFDEAGTGHRVVEVRWPLDPLKSLPSPPAHQPGVFHLSILNSDVVIAWQNWNFMI